MAKARVITVKSCGDCPYCEPDHYTMKWDANTLIRLDLRCDKLGKPIYNEDGIKRDCPLPKLTGADRGGIE